MNNNAWSIMQDNLYKSSDSHLLRKYRTYSNNSRASFPRMDETDIRIGFANFGVLACFKTMGSSSSLSLHLQHDKHPKLRIIHTSFLSAKPSAGFIVFLRDK
eukprot:scaffold89_cov318-Pavlova_lutheri.AAC.16